MSALKIVRKTVLDRSFHLEILGTLTIEWHCEDADVLIKIFRKSPDEIDFSIDILEK